jgi:hypothetical protein
MFEMVGKARQQHTLLELHNLAVEQTGDYITGCLWIIAATEEHHPGE